MTWKLLQHQLAVVGDVLALILCVRTIFLLNYNMYLHNYTDYITHIFLLCDIVV